MISHGRVSVTTHGTAVPLSATSVLAAFITFFPSKSGGTANTGQVRIGGIPLAGDSGSIPAGKGMPLNAGDAGVCWPLASTYPYDLSTIYVDSDNNSDGVQFIYGGP